MDNALDGVPQYMIRKARVVTGSKDPKELREFVLANFDQPDEFWMTEERAARLERSRSNVVMENVVRQLGQASPEALEQIGINSATAASLRLGRSVSAPAQTWAPSSHFHRTPTELDPYLVPIPQDDDPYLVPIPEDDDLDMSEDDNDTPSMRKPSRWKTLRHLIHATSALSSISKNLPGSANSVDSEIPSCVNFGDLADAVTSSVATRNDLNTQHRALLASFHQSALEAEVGWVKQLDVGDSVEILLPTEAERRRPGVASFELASEAVSKLRATGQWVSATVQGTIVSRTKVVEISVMLDPSTLDASSPLYNDSSNSMMLYYHSHNRHREGKRALAAADRGEFSVEVGSIRCTCLERVFRLPDSAHTLSTTWSPLSLVEGSTVEIHVQMQTCAKIQPDQADCKAPVYIPFHPGPIQHMWVTGKVTAVDKWIAESRLLEVIIITDDSDVAPPPSPAISSGNCELLVWNIDPSLDQGSLWKAAQSALSKTLETESAEGSHKRERAVAPVIGFAPRFLQGIGARSAVVTLSSELVPEKAETFRSELQTVTSAADGRTLSYVKWLVDVTFVLRPRVVSGTSDAMLGHEQVAALSMIPNRPQPAVLVCIGTVPRNIRCAGSAAWVKERPEALVDCKINYRQSDGTANWISGEVVSYIPKLGRHVLLTAPEKVQLVNLNEPNFIIEPVVPNVALYSSSLLARPGTNIRQCVVCYTTLDKGSTRWAEFCFERYHVDGHEVDVRGPRHIRKMCVDCLKMHCEIGLKEGKLYVKCPMEKCGRALQIRELSTIVDQNIYDLLMTRLKDAEEAEQTLEDDGINALGLELRLCPRCGVRIEKNQGCNDMQCYRCGHRFAWSHAQEVRPQVPPVSAIGAAENPAADGEAVELADDGQGMPLLPVSAEPAASVAFNFTSAEVPGQISHTSLFGWSLPPGRNARTRRMRDRHQQPGVTDGYSTPQQPVLQRIDSRDL